mgnify:CR=1 FL=1
MAKRLFTSESVTEGHPDKICDQISDAVLDAILEKDPNGRVGGILHGCNVVMPNITPQATRKSYQLYDNKAGTEVGAESNILMERKIVEMTGRTLGLNRLGSSLHWVRRAGVAPN